MRIILLGVGIACLCVLLTGCSTSSEVLRENSTQVLRSGNNSIQSNIQSEAYVIRQGDSIQIAVWGYSEFNTASMVKANGTITIPLLGDIVVGGITKDQFTADLRTRLSEYIQGEIKLVVTVSGSSIQKVTIFGAIIRQDNFPLTSNISLIEAIAMAGGVTPESDLRHVRIVRSGLDSQPIEVDLLSYLEHGNIEAVPIIRPGDTVFVPKTEDIIIKLSTYLGSAIFIFTFFAIAR